MYKLIIFDLDGTLTEYKTGHVLPGVYEWFKAHPDQQCAIASNQGGVGLRQMMLEGGYGNPEAYPTARSVEMAVERVIEKLGRDGEMAFEISYAYKTKKGAWNTPPQGEEESRNWSHGWRKPNPGMLLALMERAGVTPEETLMVGDWEEDVQAAERAGCAFEWAFVFFDRPAPEPRQKESAKPRGDWSVIE